MSGHWLNVNVNVYGEGMFNKELDAPEINTEIDPSDPELGNVIWRGAVWLVCDPASTLKAAFRIESANSAFEFPRYRNRKAYVFQYTYS